MRVCDPKGNPTAYFEAKRVQRSRVFEALTWENGCRCRPVPTPLSTQWHPSLVLWRSYLGPGQGYQAFWANLLSCHAVDCTTGGALQSCEHRHTCSLYYFSLSTFDACCVRILLLVMAVCLSVWFNSRTARRIWMKFGTYVMPLRTTVKPYFSISGLGGRCSIPDKGRGFLLQPLRPDLLWGPPSLLYSVYWGLFPWE
jgi:hypothetical protein